MPERKFFKLKVENGKLKIAVGQTVCKMQIIVARLFCIFFVYIEVAFKCMGGYYPPARRAAATK